MGLFAESRKVISKKGLFSQSRITTPSTTTPVYWNKEKDEPVNPPVAKPTSKIVMPLRPNSVRTEPASSVPKRIGGPQHEPAYAPAPSQYIPKTPQLSTQGGGIGIKPSPELSVVAQKYGGDPIKQTTAGLARGVRSLIPAITYGGAVISEAANNLTGRNPQQARDEQAFQQRQLTYAREDTNKKFGITPRDEQSLAYGLGQSVPAMATLAVPVVGSALFATSAGGSAAERANQIAPDAPAWKKALYGTAVGLAELGTEKIFFFAPGAKTFIAKKLGMTAAKVITTAIRPVGEATQEAIMDPISSLMEKILFDPDRAWVGSGGVVDLKQMNSDAQAGAIMGLVFMGMGSSNPSVKGMSEQAYANSQKTGVPVTAVKVQPILDAITLDAKKNPTAYTPNKNKFMPQPIQTQPIQQNAPQPLTGTLNANVETPSVSLTVPAPKTVKVQPPTSTRTIDVVMTKPKEKGTISEAIRGLHQRIVDSKAPLARASKEAYDAAMNSNLVGGTVDYAINGYLPDMQGNKIGESFSSLAKDVAQNKEFATYMLDRHNVDRFREGKPIDPGMDEAASQAAVKATESLHPEWKNKADGIVGWIDTLMKEWGVKSGMVDAQTYADLRKQYPSYIPTNREFTELEKTSNNPGGAKRFVDVNSPLKKATGSDRDVSNPIGNVLELTNRVVRTARYNQVGQELLSTVRTDPTKMKQWAEEISPPRAFEKVPDNIVAVWEGGSPTYLQINNKILLDTMLGLPKIINNVPAIRAVTGSFKSLITGKNPLFGLRNIARDIPTAYVAGQQINPLSFLKNMFVAGGQLVTNAEAAQQYKALGGTRGGQFSSASARQYAKGFNKSAFSKIVGAPIKFLEMFNETIEQAPRLSEFNYVLKKTGDVNKALRAAQEVTVDFSRGGNTTKSVEPFVPYLNASVQGIDKFIRVFTTPGFIGRMAKAGIAVSSVQLISFLLSTRDDDDKKAYANLDQRTKDTYFVFPKGDGTFIKVPKSREIGVLFGSLVERALSQRGIEGFEDTFSQNFFPVNPITQNFFSPAIMNLPTNKDFAKRTIEPVWMGMQGLSPSLRTDENTSETGKMIGNINLLGKKLSDMTGLSPIQIDYLIRSYTGVIGQLLLPATTERVGGAGAVNKILTGNFIADPAFSSQRVTDFYNKLDELKTIRADKNVVENIPSKDLTPEEEMYNAFNALSTIASDTSKYAKTLKGDDPKIRAIREINNEYMGMAVKATTAKELKTIKTEWNKAWNKAQ